MTDFAVKTKNSPSQSFLSQQSMRLLIVLFLLIALMGLLSPVLTTFQNATIEDSILIDSSLGQLALWMAEQTENEPADIDSALVVYAKNWASQLGEESLDHSILLESMRNLLVVWNGIIFALLILGLVLLFVRPKWNRVIFLLALLALDGLLFVLPPVYPENLLTPILWSIIATLGILLIAPGKVTKVVGFFVAISVLLVAWQASKAFAASVDYRITLPQNAWEYSTYNSLDESLTALQAGEVNLVIADRKDLDELMSPYSDIASETFQYADLSYLDNFDRSDGVGFLPVSPEFPGRLAVAVRTDTAEQYLSVPQILGQKIATVADEFADEKFLSLPRDLVLLDMKILNDLNLPHLQDISEAFLQPARRNGSQLLIEILAEAGAYTLGEAVFGFILGATFGFILGTIFAHSPLMERGILPYVVASQTVPILAIAPMVVIWLGASPTSVAVIAAYLTFFPVTINTLRGLQSPKPTEIELMRSYAADKWTIMWKLRFPAALPYIFTALKVSATSSVVGAIIGELPSGMGDGLGRAILDFSSDYSLISTPKLWAAIVMSSLIGIFFFLTVTLLERLALGRTMRTVD